MSRAEESALKAYPIQGEWVGNQYGEWDDDKNQELRKAFLQGYKQDEKDIIEHCEKRIAEYNEQNLSNMFLRRAFEDVIRFIKEIPYNDYNDYKDDEI